MNRDVHPSEPGREPFPLRGRTVVVTGVSRRAGIGYATACLLASYGANLFCHHFAPHDAQQPWGSDAIDAVLAGVRSHLVEGARVADRHADLTESGAPEELLAAAAAEFGQVDALICNQAHSGSDGAVGELTTADLDRHWAVNARASILLAQAFAAQSASAAPDPGEASPAEGFPAEGFTRSIVFLTSGQGQGPMPGEIAYAAAKAALAGVTTTIADQLADHGIRVNTVNPGPVDTGYLTPELWRAVAPKFPFGRYGQPEDPARLIAWLVTDEAAWITGQVINTEGGFGRWRSHAP